MSLNDKIHRSEKEENFDKIDDEIARQLGDGLWAMNIEKNIKNVNVIEESATGVYKGLLLVLLWEVLISLVLIFFAPGYALNRNTEVALGLTYIMGDSTLNSKSSTDVKLVLESIQDGEGYSEEEME